MKLRLNASAAAQRYRVTVPIASHATHGYTTLALTVCAWGRMVGTMCANLAARHSQYSVASVVASAGCCTIQGWAV